MIYIIQDEKCRIKIGFSKSEQGAKRRLSAMKTGNPGNLRLKHVFDGSVTHERALHRLFKKYRVAGEWFFSEDPCDAWYYHASTYLKMDGPKLLDMDISEIDHFAFCPGLNPPGVPVLNLRTAA